ncbi:MAG: hypothetical protein RR214_01735 [Synergistaceae bacterium]
MNKKFCTAAVSFLLALLLIAPLCEAASYDAGARAKKIWFDTLNRSAHSVLLKYKMLGAEPATLTMAMDKTRVAVDMNSADGHTSVIHDTKLMQSTMVMHEDKMYMVMKTDPRQIPKLAGEKAEKPTTTFTAGTEKINGKTYDFDKIVFDKEEPQLYYFEPGTDKWKYWRAGGELFEILEYGTAPDKSLFTVPDGYEKISM